MQAQDYWHNPYANRAVDFIGELRNTAGKFARQRFNMQKRARLSNEREDDYFISIHRNAFEPEVAQGVETYVHPKADPHAVSLAQRIQNGLRGLGFADRGVKMANFQVLRQTEAPAVLVEVGFIDHTKDNIRFDTKRDRIVEVLADAILEQVGLSPDVGSVELSLDDSIEVLTDHGIIHTPEYWRQHAVREETVRGEYAAVLLQRMAKLIRRQA